MRRRSVVRLVLIPAVLAALAVGLAVRATVAGSKPPLHFGISDPVVARPVAHDVSPPLRVLARRTRPSRSFQREIESAGAQTERGPRAIPALFSRISGPPATRKLAAGANPFTGFRNFAGITTAELNAGGLAVANFAADNSGAIGPNHYVQSVNFAYRSTTETARACSGRRRRPPSGTASRRLPAAATGRTS